MIIKLLTLFAYTAAVTEGFVSNNSTSRDLTQDMITASTVDRTDSNAEITSKGNKDHTSTTIWSLTEFTVRHEVSECLDTATQFAYQDNLCADASDPESYLDLGRSRYTCMDRCGQAPTYGRKVNECGCDARCKWLGDCCRDMEQMCPEYYNAEPLGYSKLLRWSSACPNYLVIEAYEDVTYMSSTKPYPDVSQSSETSNKELHDKPRIIQDSVTSLLDFRVVETKTELIFHDYHTYMKYSSFKETFHFIPKTLYLECPFKFFNSKSYPKALQLLPLCQVTNKDDVMTKYRRPCKVNYIVVCRCEDGSSKAEHLHNVCLGQNFSQNRDYRYQLWDNQADLNSMPTKLKNGNCKLLHQTALSISNPLKSRNVPLPECNSKMRISPVLSHSLADEEKGIKDDIDINMDQGLKINFIVELNNTLETRFYCSSLQSRLQDCRLDGCAEGGLLWIGHLSNGQSAHRFCIVPVEARVLYEVGLSSIPLCTCLNVMSVLEDLELWNIRLLWNQGRECSLSLVPIPKNGKPPDEIYQFENYTLDQINSDQLFERLVNTTKSCPQHGGHKFQICFLTSKADNEAESGFDACLTWGSDNLNESPVYTIVFWILMCQYIILLILSYLL